MINRLEALKMVRHVASVTIFATLFFYKMSEDVVRVLFSEASFEMPWVVWGILWAIFYREYRKTLKYVEGRRDDEI